MARICPKCHWGHLKLHPSLAKWLKCPVCGYCEEEGATRFPDGPLPL